jgi:calmodulin
MSKSIEEIRETFNHFDKDGNGTIDAAEFKELLDALGAVCSDEELAAGIQILDSDKNGTIDFDEFKDWWGDQ